MDKSQKAFSLILLLLLSACKFTVENLRAPAVTVGESNVFVSPDIFSSNDITNRTAMWLDRPELFTQLTNDPSIAVSNTPDGFFYGPLPLSIDKPKPGDHNLFLAQFDEDKKIMRISEIAAFTVQPEIPPVQASAVWTLTNSRDGASVRVRLTSTGSVSEIILARSSIEGYFSNVYSPSILDDLGEEIIFSDLTPGTEVRWNWQILDLKRRDVFVDGFSAVIPEPISEEELSLWPDLSLRYQKIPSLAAVDFFFAQQNYKKTWKRFAEIPADTNDCAWTYWSAMSDCLKNKNTEKAVLKLYGALTLSNSDYWKYMTRLRIGMFLSAFEKGAEMQSKALEHLEFCRKQKADRDEADDAEFWYIRTLFQLSRKDEARTAAKAAFQNRIFREDSLIFDPPSGRLLELKPMLRKLEAL